MQTLNLLESLIQLAWWIQPEPEQVPAAERTALQQQGLTELAVTDRYMFYLNEWE